MSLMRDLKKQIVQSLHIKWDFQIWVIKKMSNKSGGELPAYRQVSNFKQKKELRRSLRNNATSAERKLWRSLQNKKLDGFKFRRQHSIDRYILDFFCPSVNLAIELDGETHYTPEAIEYDRTKSKH